jgi:hypothetical protein
VLFFQGEIERERERDRERDRERESETLERILYALTLRPFPTLKKNTIKGSSKNIIFV